MEFEFDPKSSIFTVNRLLQALFHTKPSPPNTTSSAVWSWRDGPALLIGVRYIVPAWKVFPPVASES